MTLRLRDPAGRPVTLADRLGRGGEGEVFAVADAPDVVAKLIYPTGRTKTKFDKLRTMIARPPTGAYDLVDGFPVLTWPRSLLLEEPGRAAAGYTMARIQARDFVPFYKVTSAGRRKELGGQPITWDRLVLLGIRLCHVVRTLHRLDYAVGDMNDRNVLVSRRFTPLFMDTDSFQVPKPGFGHYPCVVGDQMYWPPEHLDLDYNSFRGSRVTGDRYALAVLLFQLFMNGRRPYQARGSLVDGLETLVEKTRAGHYPWHDPRPGVLEPPAGAPRYESLPAPIRSAFERAFVKGHHKPGRRPSAEDWYRALRGVRDAGYQTCPDFALHVFSARQTSCPWCEDANNAFGLPRGWKPRRPVRAAPSPKPVRTPAPTVVAPTRSPARRSKPSRPTTPPPPAPKPAAAKPRTQRPVAAARGPRSWLRTAWVLVVVLACATPLLVLPLFPMVAAKKVALFGLTTLWIGGGLSAVTWKRIAARRAVLIALGYVTFAAALAALASQTLGWLWLDYVNALGATTLGVVVFLVLERKQKRPLWPRPRGFLHAAASVLAAYIPVGAVWLSSRL